MTQISTNVNWLGNVTTVRTVESDVDALPDRCKRLISKMDQTLLLEAGKLGWGRGLERCQAVPGIGPLTAVALTAIFHQRAFRSVDAFILFMGMDVWLRQSGRW